MKKPYKVSVTIAIDVLAESPQAAINDSLVGEDQGTCSRVVAYGRGEWVGLVHVWEMSGQGNKKVAGAVNLGTIQSPIILEGQLEGQLKPLPSTGISQEKDQQADHDRFAMLELDTEDENGK